MTMRSTRSLPTFQPDCCSNGVMRRTPAAVPAGQGDDRLGELIFVVSLRGLVTLGSPRLAYQLARMPFTQSLVPSVLDGDAAPLGTQKFP
jgi:hypothetical protein